MAAPRKLLEVRVKASKNLQSTSFWRWLGDVASYTARDFGPWARKIRALLDDEERQTHLNEAIMSLNPVDVFVSVRALQGDNEALLAQADRLKEQGLSLDVAVDICVPEASGAVSDFLIAYANFHRSRDEQSSTGYSQCDLAIDVSAAASNLRHELDAISQMARSLDGAVLNMLKSESRLDIAVQYSLSPIGIADSLTAIHDAYAILCDVGNVDLERNSLEVHYIEQGSTVFAFTGLQEIVAILTKGIEIASRLVWRRTTHEGRTATQADLRAELAAAIDLRNAFVTSGIATVVIDERLQKAGEEYALALLRLVSEKNPLRVNDKPFAESVGSASDRKQSAATYEMPINSVDDAYAMDNHRNREDSQ